MNLSALRSDTGVVAPATALVLACAVGMVGLVTDVGVWFVQRRALQSVTDAAALAASPYAATPATARAKADEILTANGFDPTTTVSGFTAGWYCQDASLAAASRFQATRCATDPAASDANAVRLSTRAKAPMILSRAVAGADVNDKVIGVKATAARINQAGMEAGVGTVQLSAGVANAALTALTGGSGVNLTLVQYQGLAQARVDALDLMDALAVKANVTTGTYDQVMASQLSVGQVLDAAAAVLAEHGQVAGATAAIQGLQVIKNQIPGSPQITLGELIDLGVWDKMKVGHGDESASALRAGLNVYQLATFALQLANGHHAVTIPNSQLGITGLASLGVQAMAIEPPQKAYFAFGQKGLTVHSAAVRLKLGVSLLNTTYLGTGVQLPLYIEVAGGDATTTSVCPRDTDGKLKSEVTVSGRGGLADVWIGAPSDAVMNNFAVPVTSASIQPAPLVGVRIGGLLATNVLAKAHVSAASPAATSKTFCEPGRTCDGMIGRSASDPRGVQAPVSARFGSQNILSGLMPALADDLTATYELCALGICARLPVPAANLVGALGVLDPVLSVLDAPIDALLKALGVNVGYIDVFVTGVKCGVPVLVE